jgi:RNA-binding protein YhbY
MFSEIESTLARHQLVAINLAGSCRTKKIQLRNEAREKESRQGF